MNKNILIVLGGGLVIAILVAVLVQFAIGGGKEEVQKVEVEKRVQILVAAKDLSIGRELKEGDTRWRDWPEGTVFPGAIKRKDNQTPEEALEGRLKRAIAQGEPMVKTALFSSKDGNLVAASLEPGMRAVAIEVSASSMVAGFISPGDYVDVVLTYKETIKAEDDNPQIQNMLEMNLDKLATETILQNVKVLAVDQMAKPSEEGKIKVGKTVTLALNPQDSERITLAAEMGILTLILRGIGDDKEVEKDWPTTSDARLITINDELFSEYNKLKEDSGIKPNVVRIYAGENVTSTSVK